MFTFSLKKPYFLGIDFGTSHIKAVELTLKDGRPYLVNYGEVEISSVEGDASSQFHSSEERLQLCLKELIRRFKPKSEAAHVAMPGFGGLITLIELPKMNKEELDQAIQFEAHKYIPSSLDDVALSWDVVSRKTPPISMEEKLQNPPQNTQHTDVSSKMEVLLVAALHKDVEKYEGYMKMSGLKIELLELETFSLVRALASEVDGNFLIIDMGSRATNLVLIENGMIKVNRNLNAGGNEVTSTIAEGLNVSWERANILKMSDKDLLNAKEASIVFPALELITGEARRIFSAYQAKDNSYHVDGIILSGGASKMKGLDVYFSKIFNMPVTMGNPWKNIVYDERLKPAISRLGVSYSVAIGLALAGISNYERS